MKILANHIILYDADCAMCRTYTKAFIKTGMLDKSGLQSYQHVSYESCPLVDRQRAVNEIALVNNITGEVSYGITSLFKVIGNSLPVIKPLFSCKPFSWLMSKLYAFISYNRKVIMPARITDTNVIQPTFRLDYRISYLIFTWLVTSFILTGYTKLLHPLVPVGSSYREFLICGGQVIFQGIIIHKLMKGRCWDYLGNMMTISLAGALLLLPALLIIKHYHLSPTIAGLYFMATAGLLLLEHIRRMKILGISLWLTLSWIAYRLLVLLFILKLI
jgi:predicted DCC family thiol-disulfide oxidoreductase YuxK